MIYLDYAATTPVCETVLESMLPYFTADFGNASSIDHSMGLRARAAVESARSAIADLVGASAEDVIFTSGSTEANNLVLTVPGAVVTSAIEHPSILDTIIHRKGVDPSDLVPVDRRGKVERSQFAEQLTKRAPILATIMYVNNEIGTRQDVEELAAIAAERDVLFHTDATQAVISEKINMREMGIAGVSLSAHKIYGPKGIGALVCRPSLRRKLSAIAFGGGHERGLRSGTLNVPGIVGFGVAARLAHEQRISRTQHLSSVRTAFLRVLASTFTGTMFVNGADTSPHICSVRLALVNNRALLKATASTICFSLGSACATNKSEASHVLLALGMTKAEAAETIRISFGKDSSLKDVEVAAKTIGLAANNLVQMLV